MKFDRTTEDKDVCNGFLYVTAGLIFMFSSWLKPPPERGSTVSSWEQALLKTSVWQLHLRKMAPLTRVRKAQRFLYVSIEWQMTSP